MSGAAPEVTVVTVNYNGLRDTLELLASLRASVRDITYEVIVVDNHSAAGEADTLARLCPDATVIASPRNLGFAGGNNLALPRARGRHILFINNDTLVAGDGLRALVRRLDGGAALVSPKICGQPDRGVIQYAGYTPLSPVTLRNRAVGFGEADRGQHDTARPTPYAHGGAMMVSRAALEAVGPMHEGYFLYYEELDWAERMRRAGLEVWYDPAWTVYHKESRSTGKGSPLQAYYMTRSRLLFARRNRRGLVRALATLYLCALTLARFLAARDRASARAGLRGMTDFLKGGNL